MGRKRKKEGRKTHNIEIKKKKIEIQRRKEEKLTIFPREIRELEEKERLRIWRIE